MFSNVIYERGEYALQLDLRGGAGAGGTWSAFGALRKVTLEGPIDISKTSSVKFAGDIIFADGFTGGVFLGRHSRYNRMYFTRFLSAEEQITGRSNRAPRK